MSFKRLEEVEVWQRGCRLAVDVYKFTAEGTLGKDWGLRDQIRRAAVSIPSNIAEGYERNSTGEFKRFLSIAKGSCGELRTQLYIVKALEMAAANSVDLLIEECIQISSMIQSLVNYLKKQSTKS